MNATAELITNTRNADLESLVGILRTQRARAFDVVAPATSFRFRDGNLAISGMGPQLFEDGVTDVNGSYTPTRVADEGVASKLDIPISYLRRLREQRSWMYDANVNGWLHGKAVNRGGEREIVSPADDRDFLLRLFRAEGDGQPGVLRAMLSNGYKVVDNLDLLMAVLSGMGQESVQITSCDLTERRMRVQFHSPAVQAMAPTLLGGYRNPFDTEDTNAERQHDRTDVDFWRGVAEREGMGYERGKEPVVFAGFELSNSEVGSGAVVLQPKLLVRICRNGLTLPAFARRDVHLGKRLDAGAIEWSAETQDANAKLIASQAADAVRTWLSPGFLNDRIQEIESKAGRGIDKPEKTIKLVAKQQGYTDGEVDGILSHFILGGQPTAGGLLNAVTSFSQTVRDADRAAELETNALRVLDLV